MSKLITKVIIVTGVSKGIRAEIIKNSGTAVAIQANLSNSTDVKNLFEEAKKHTVH